MGRPRKKGHVQYVRIPEEDKLLMQRIADGERRTYPDCLRIAIEEFIERHLGLPKVSGLKAGTASVLPMAQELEV